MGPSVPKVLMRIRQRLAADALVDVQVFWSHYTYILFSQSCVKIEATPVWFAADEAKQDAPAPAGFFQTDPSATPWPAASRACTWEVDARAPYPSDEARERVERRCLEEHGWRLEEQTQ